MLSRLLKRYGYALLWGLPGMLVLLEGVRINKAFLSTAWIARPGSYLIITGVVLLCFACYEIFVNIREQQNEDDGQPLMTVNIIKSIVFLLGYVLLIPYLGFILASLIFLIFIMKMFKNSYKAIVLTIMIGFSTMYFLFPPLGITLARGPLGF